MPPRYETHPQGDPSEPRPLLAQLIEGTIARFLQQTHKSDGEPYTLIDVAKDTICEHCQRIGQSPIDLISPVLKETTTPPQLLPEVLINANYPGTWEDVCLEIETHIVEDAVYRSTSQDVIEQDQARINARRDFILARRSHESANP